MIFMAGEGGDMHEISLSRCIDDEIRLSKDLAKAKDAAEAANRAKSTFLFNMSHDIRTPMNAIMGYTALAASHLDNPETTKDYLNMISVSSNHLLSLINDVLDMSRIESSRVKIEEKEVYLPDVLHDLRTIIQSNIAAKQQDLFIDTQDIIHEDIITDKLRLNQVVLNIVSNAIKFTPVGGTISVKSGEEKGSEFLVVLDCKLPDTVVKYEPIPELKGARALVADDDTNTCISVSKMLKQIGMRADWTVSGKEAIVRAKEAYEEKDKFKVYIIDWLMPDMNGVETVRRIRKVIGDSTPIIILTAYDWSDIEEGAREAGVTAFVMKPLFMSELREVPTRPVRVASAKEKPVETVDFAGKRILLVEDNELNQEIAAEILKEAGFAVDIAGDGIVAVDKMASAASDCYDLILMDVQMPRMNGFVATREIRTLSDSKKANIPIIAMTANAFDEDKKLAFEAGMNGFVAKPINIEALMRTLADVLKE